MGSMNRKIRRAKKKRAEKEMAAKVALFGKLSDECLVCEKPFDKNLKEHVSTWNVVVRKDQEKVNLYCPECWGGARKKVLKAMEELDDTRIRESEADNPPTGESKSK